MTRILIPFLVFSVSAFAAKGAPKSRDTFEGVWKADLHGHVYAVLTILSHNPLRGTVSRGGFSTNATGEVIEVTRDPSMDLYIQAPKIVKGALHFKTVDPNDGELNYKLQLLNDSEGLLSIGSQTIHMTRR